MQFGDFQWPRRRLSLRRQGWRRRQASSADWQPKLLFDTHPPAFDIHRASCMQDKMILTRVQVEKYVQIREVFSAFIQYQFNCAESSAKRKEQKRKRFAHLGLTSEEAPCSFIVEYRLFALYVMSSGLFTMTGCGGYFFRELFMKQNAFYGWMKKHCWVDKWTTDWESVERNSLSNFVQHHSNAQHEHKDNQHSETHYQSCNRQERIPDLQTTGLWQSCEIRCPLLQERTCVFARIVIWRGALYGGTFTRHWDVVRVQPFVARHLHWYFCQLFYSQSCKTCVWYSWCSLTFITFGNWDFWEHSITKTTFLCKNSFWALMIVHGKECRARFLGPALFTYHCTGARSPGTDHCHQSGS